MADRVSSVVITVGGIGTIVSVLCVFLVLFVVVVPMFKQARLGEPTSAPFVSGEREPLAVKVDEYRVLAWALFSDGTIEAFRVDNGVAIWSDDLVDGDLEISSASILDTSPSVALALSDGRILMGKIGFQTAFVADEEVQADVRSLKQGGVATLGDGVVQVTPQNQYRLQRVSISLWDPKELAGKPIRKLRHVPNPRGYAIAAIAEDGDLFWGTARESEDVLTGETTLKISRSVLPNVEGIASMPDDIFVIGTGNNVCALWNDGRIVRYDTRSRNQIAVAEMINVFEGKSDRTVTVAKLSIGNETLNIGDSDGGITSWFGVRSAAATTPDGRWLLPIHELGESSSAVSAMGTSYGSRMLTVGHEDGLLRVCHVTTDQQLVEVKLPTGARIESAFMGPKDDSIFALSDGKLWSIDLDPAYPETTFSSLFGRVWYEGYDQPDHVWQSMIAGVEPEMKLGLRPLVFGTLKGTVYSMLFGAPLALLAALYTSEILSPRWRSPVKSLIEMMASLPSVVLGFLAGLVIAPYMEDVVPVVLSTFFVVPCAIALGSFLWQQLPQRAVLRLSSYRLLFVAMSIACGVFGAIKLGPVAERLFFANDIMLWLDGQKGNGIGAWMLMFLPLSAALTSFFVTLVINPILVQRATNWTRPAFNVVNLCKFLVATVCALAMAYVLSSALNGVGWDPRGTFVSTYVQRNAMVVGFAMGFAIIPIIYTISEDALSTVPRHLRSASLGSGATPWQTAVRVVMPTAMSGLFSALMIGLGRAVGETMIVLMAAGNTPIEEWNAFNGFRTLSANIATEISDAVPGSTHYRTLFLAALTLLVMTFIVNTVAELVRLRFRKRAVQL